MMMDSGKRSDIKTEMENDRGYNFMLTTSTILQLPLLHNETISEMLELISGGEVERRIRNR